MDKAQALNKFWSSFDIPAYDENTVPDDAQMPYITYQTLTDSIGSVLPMSATLWYGNTYVWDALQQKAEEIAQRIGQNGYYLEKIDGGYVWLTKGTPFAQRMQSEQDNVRQIYINVTVEFLTAY